MRIGIDISQVVYGTGVSAYTRKLVKSLLTIDKENEYFLFGGSLRRRGELDAFIDNLQQDFTFKSKIFSIPPTAADLIWNRWHILPVEKLIGEVDVLHSSDWSQPPSRAFKITTVHDLVPILHPGLAARDMIRNVAKTHRRRLFWVKKEADRIIVPSEATKVDLVKLGFNKGKIRVIPEAPDPVFKSASVSKIEEVKKKCGISGKYLLSVGINPRKNTKRIIKAFQKIRKQGQNKRLSLAIIGYPYMGLAETEGVRILGHVLEIDKPALFSGAEALVYPSLYEGFGLPILEAFACKTAVVTSNLGSMKEVAGDAAVLVNPKKTDSISEGIEKILKEREIYIKMGVKRVKTFSWTKTAKKTLEVYREAKNI